MFISTLLASSLYFMVTQYASSNGAYLNSYRTQFTTTYDSTYDCYQSNVTFDSLDMDGNYYVLELYYQDGSTNERLVSFGQDGLIFESYNYSLCNVKYVLTAVDDYGSSSTILKYDLMVHQGDVSFPFTYPNDFVPEITLRFKFFLYSQEIYDSYVQGSSNAYENGYNTGYEQGYHDGALEGNQYAYDEGYAHGHRDGYNYGYVTGLNTTTYTFKDLFASVSDTPILMLRRLFGFELFGTSLMTVFVSLITALIVVMIIKKVAKR